MRTLILNKFLHRNGGSETYIFKLGEALEQHGHEVQYFGMVHEGRCVGELQEAMKNKARTLGIEDAVIFYGASNEMNKMWQAMDVFVMPSLHEGLPVTGVEAQASGLSCVFSDAITKEVGLTSNTEFLSLQEKPDVWAEHILKYMNVQRKSERKILEQAGYDIQQTADTLAQLYLNVAEKL